MCMYVRRRGRVRPVLMYVRGRESPICFVACVYVCKRKGESEEQRRYMNWRMCKCCVPPDATHKTWKLHSPPPTCIHARTLQPAPMTDAFRLTCSPKWQPSPTTQPSLGRTPSGGSHAASSRGRDTSCCCVYVDAWMCVCVSVRMWVIERVSVCGLVRCKCEVGHELLIGMFGWYGCQGGT